MDITWWCPEVPYIRVATTLQSLAGSVVPTILRLVPGKYTTTKLYWGVIDGDNTVVVYSPVDRTAVFHSLTQQEYVSQVESGTLGKGYRYFNRGSEELESYISTAYTGYLSRNADDVSVTEALASLEQEQVERHRSAGTLVSKDIRASGEGNSVLARLTYHNGGSCLVVTSLDTGEDIRVNTVFPIMCIEELGIKDNIVGVWAWVRAARETLPALMEYRMVFNYYRAVVV